MLTIDIPKVNAQESAEDELAQYILDEIEAKTVAYFKYFTADQNNGTATVGDWQESTGDWYGDYKEPLHESSLDVVRTVIRAFRQKGYLVKDAFTFAHYNQVTISK